MISSLLWRIFKIFSITLVVSFIVIFLTQLENLSDVESEWRYFLYGFSGLLYLLCFIYIGLTLRFFCVNLGIKDIEIYCNQTEIARHNKNSKEILKNFLEEMHNVGEEGGGRREDEELISINEKLDAKNNENEEENHINLVKNF